MSSKRDPIQEVVDSSRDLYDIVDWEVRTPIDRAAVKIYAGIVKAARSIVILMALLILVAQFTLVGVVIFDRPLIAVYILLSIIPAFGLAAFLWRSDVGTNEPLKLLVITFLLGLLFANFAAVVNSFLSRWFLAIPVIGMILFFFIIVGPIEEVVKWLAVRLFAYRSPQFNTVIDGAVYGAMAGLGFATIENSLYIAQQYLTALNTAGLTYRPLQITAIRTFAGPGHVIYSGFAGYYLGLAKFNQEHAGPIVVKGLLIAAIIHATYNSIVSNLEMIVGLTPLQGIPMGIAFIGFVFIYDGIFGFILYRKLKRYRRIYHRVGAESDLE
ncbi:MAG: PrsW family intramembrane metalloprotease [Halobacteriaceae archaeon]